ncbi:MAG: alpha/beta hydrolase [Actinobacteria bacterium]|nr:alpha/beta hydrolase [Actinomycetota bacterium]
MTFVTPHSITVEDPTYGPITLSVHEQGDGPAVVFSHGFPELAYSWRHQLPAVAAAGFRAIAPDQRGYGRSSAPEPIAAYGLGQLTADLVGLLDELDIDRAVFVGHDWGGFVVWAMGVLHPERVAGIVGICTPYSPFPSTEFLKMVFGDDVEKQYMLWFQKPGVAEAVLDSRARLVFEKLMRGGVDPTNFLKAVDGTAGKKRNGMNPFISIETIEPGGEMIATPEEIDHYVTEFSRTGFRGGINWYRNIDANGANFPEVGKTIIAVPTLMICAEWDPALPPALAANMANVCSDLEMHTVAKAGHWVQQESPEAVNALLVDWLQRRFG